MPDKIPPTEAETDNGKQVQPRPHDAGSEANETADGLTSTTEALRHLRKTRRPVLCLMILRPRRYSTGQT